MAGTQSPMRSQLGGSTTFSGDSDDINEGSAHLFLTSSERSLIASAIQQAALDAAVAGLYDHKGGYAADTNTPDLDTSPSGIKKGDAYTVSAAGNFFAVAVEAGDVLIANQDDPTQASHWTIVNRNIDSSAFATSAQGALADTALQPADVLDAVYNIQTGTSYSLQDSDNGKIVGFTNGSAIAVDGLEGRAVNFQCTIVQIGAGVPTVSPSTDTINGAGTGVAPSAQWKAMYLSQFADTEWLAIL